MVRLVYGVGINDADYVVNIMEYLGYVDGKRKQRKVWRCPYYTVWSSMIERCYSSKFGERNPTYKDCIVCDEWLLFSNFKSWMETQDWEGKELDKDILIPENRVYSPYAGVFISPRVNTFVNEKASKRGEWPIGVCWHAETQKFMARCRNPFSKNSEYLGVYLCPDEAHQAWLKRKLELAKLLAAEQDDPRVAKALVERYENYDCN